jgi:hypothetical protein
MTIESVSIRLVAVALIAAALAACSGPSDELPLGAGAAEKQAAAANRDALKGFSSGKAPAWEAHKFGAKPSKYTPWEESKTKEGEHHE